MKNKRSYKYHNGYINYVSITGIIKKRTTTRDKTQISIYNLTHKHNYILHVPFKLSWIKYPVGTYVSTISCIVPVDSYNGLLSVGLRLKNIDIVTMDKDLKSEGQEQHMVQVSGFVGSITELTCDKLEIQLLQEYNAEDIKNENIPVIINCNSHLNKTKLQIGQALFIKGTIVSEDEVVHKIITHPNMVQLTTTQSPHILKAPDWLSKFYQAHNLNQSSTISNVDGLMKNYATRIKV